MHPSTQLTPRCAAAAAAAAQIDVMWWPRFVLSILLYSGTAVAALAYIRDVVFFTVDRTTRVIVR